MSDKICTWCFEECRTKWMDTGVGVTYYGSHETIDSNDQELSVCCEQDFMYVEDDYSGIIALALDKLTESSWGWDDKKTFKEIVKCLNKIVKRKEKE